ncbi:hypothetical protein EV401DRAFT_2070900 [Pisolithus croceorrhizus]|nr:hypothetical protein EV401DRAFT_2070900 [Pisolithus croceorrhizus]
MSLAETAASVSGAFDSIPIIDIGHASTPDERIALAQQIREACVNVGFFYIRNHSIPQETIDKVFSAMKAYFSLPLETKMKPMLGSNADPANKGDLHEGFRIDSADLVPKENDEKRANDGTMDGEDVWPSEPAEFREACLNYYHAAIDVGKVLFRLFALALNLPETYFDDKTKNSAAVMRFLHYPPQTGPEDDGIVGVGTHSDFECFTILWQEPNIQALQLLNSEKRWVDAPAIPGTLVINIGDQLARWTNDVFRSTVHRAINRTGLRRHSIPLFFCTDQHVRIEPMPSCVSPERPPKYEPITAGDYVHQRLQDFYLRNTTFS